MGSVPSSIARHIASFGFGAGSGPLSSARGSVSTPAGSLRRTLEGRRSVRPPRTGFGLSDVLRLLDHRLVRSLPAFVDRAPARHVLDPDPDKGSDLEAVAGVWRV